MRTLIFQVTAQKIEKDPDCDFSGIVAGTSGYLRAKFRFSPEWQGLVKVAIFYSPGEEYPVKLENDECTIPSEALKWRLWSVSVLGGKKGYRLPTGKVEVKQDGT